MYGYHVEENEYVFYVVKRMFKKLINWWKHEHLYDVVDYMLYPTDEGYDNMWKVILLLRCKCKKHTLLKFNYWGHDHNFHNINWDYGQVCFIDRIESLKQQPLSRFKFLCK